jgi:hypothetical protein
MGMEEATGRQNLEADDSDDDVGCNIFHANNTQAVRH